MAGTIYLEEEATGESEEQAAHLVYQCRNCFTVYDEAYGDELGEVAAGTPFEALTTYHCPTCEAPKEEFVPVEMQALPMGKA